MASFPQKKLQVFVSSTYTDLIKERQAAVESILLAGHIPAGMELFTSGDESQLDVIKQWINESDVFLLILGGRYGSIEPKSGKSYIQLEYEHALNMGKPLFACVIDEAALDNRVREYGASVMERENPQQLREFRNLVLSKISKKWVDHRDIKSIILETLLHLPMSKHDKLVGWVRAPINGLDNEVSSNTGIRLVTPQRRKLPKEFHKQKYSTEKFDLLAVAVKDCLKELALDPEDKMVKRILCDGARCQIIFVHPDSKFLIQRAREDKANEVDVIKLQRDSVKYVVMFFKKLRTFLDREKENLDPNKFGNVKIRLIDRNPYITIERFGDEINWGIYTSYEEGKNCAMFAVTDKQDSRQSIVFDQLKHHFYELLDHGEPLLTLTNGVLDLKHNLVNSILTKDELDEVERLLK